MGITIKENGEVAVMIEVTEGTYLAPASGADYIQALSDGLEMTPAKEVLDRTIMDGNIGRLTPRQGTSSVSGSISVELKSSGTAGVAPESAPLYKGALGAQRSFVTKTSSDADGGTHTSTRICLADGDAAVFNVGDIVTTKRAGAYHTSPIVSKSDVAGNNHIMLLVADPAGAYVDGIAIEAGVTFYTANSGHPSLSVSKYVEGAVLEQAAGCRISSMAVNNFATGQLADVSFGFEGINFDRSVTASPYTPSFDTAFPVVVLKACVYVDGAAYEVSDFSLSLENSLAWKTPTCSTTGRSAGRIAGRTVSGSFTPYKQDDSVANFTKFKNGTEFSVFVSAYVPTSTAGQYEDVVGFYLPKCMITEIGEADQDGILQDAISFAVTRGTDGSNEELYIGFN